MTIYLGSRYETAVVDFISLDATGNAAPVVFYEFPEIGRLVYNEHRWTAGDRLESLATTYYRDPEAWWIIAQANPEIEDIQNVPAGTVLRIPNV